MMALTLHSLLTLMFVSVTDARLDMTFYTSPARIADDNDQWLYCSDVLSADNVIVQKFGRVINTGTLPTGPGDRGPSEYGNEVVQPESIRVDIESGLPLYTEIYNDKSSLGHMLRMFKSGFLEPFKLSVGSERVGIFYCDTNTTDDRQDYTRIQLINLADNADVVPSKRTTTINPNKTVTLEMQAANGNTGLRWRLDEVPFEYCDDQSLCEVNKAGIYECYYEGDHEEGLHAIVRVIVRDCPADKWDPSWGCEKVCVECINGGVCDDRIGDCVCPPGFYGTHCEQTCEPHYVGPTCGIKRGHSDAYFCLPDPYGCSCTTGWQGHDCESACDGYHFGADCALECHCASGECDQYTGKCDSGWCAAGWSGHNCQYISSTVPSFTNVKVKSGEQTTFTCVVHAYPRPSETQISITLGSSGLNIGVNYAIDPANHTVIIKSTNVNVTTGEEYYCTVTSSATTGGFSQSILVNLFTSPSMMKGPSFFEIGSSHVTVGWNPFSNESDSGDGPVLKYRVHYRKATQNNFTLFGQTTGTNLTVTGLQESTIYHFAVTAYGPLGWGNYSPSAQATTTLVNTITIGSSSSHLSVGAIIGIVLAVVTILININIFLVFGIRICKRHKKHSKLQQYDKNSATIVYRDDANGDEEAEIHGRLTKK